MVLQEKASGCIFRHLPLLLSLLFSPQMYFYAAYVFQEAGIPQDTIPYVVIGTGSCELITSVTCVRLFKHCWHTAVLTVRNFEFTLSDIPRKHFITQRSGKLSAFVSRGVNAVFCKTLHCHHCLKNALWKGLNGHCASGLCTLSLENETFPSCLHSYSQGLGAPGMFVSPSTTILLAPARPPPLSSFSLSAKSCSGTRGSRQESKQMSNILLYFTVLLCAEHDYRLRWPEATAAGRIHPDGRMGHCLHGRSESAGNGLHWII